MVQTKRRRKWKCHESGSSIFFDDLASQRYYLPISSLPHRESMEDFHSRDAMLEICFERGAKSIFRLSGELVSTGREKGMMCFADVGMLKQEDSISSQMATEEYKNMCRWM